MQKTSKDRWEQQFLYCSKSSADRLFEHKIKLRARGSSSYPFRFLAIVACVGAGLRIMVPSTYTWTAVAFLAGVMLYYRYMIQIVEESVLIVSSLGIQVSSRTRTSLANNSFVPFDTISGIAISEAIVGHSIRHVLIVGISRKDGDLLRKGSAKEQSQVVSSDQQIDTEIQGKSPQKNTHVRADLNSDLDDLQRKERTVERKTGNKDGTVGSNVLEIGRLEKNRDCENVRQDAADYRTVGKESREGSMEHRVNEKEPQGENGVYRKVDAKEHRKDNEMHRKDYKQHRKDSIAVSRNTGRLVVGFETFTPPIHILVNVYKDAIRLLDAQRTS